MRRTYKSKKEAIGALDRRDMMQNLNENSSAFDAFYIQNLKQTKREMSTIVQSSYGRTNSSKVRKKKYVKRIVKEVEPAYHSETISSSAYLTPDKSIRVNKILDAFDMLLNSTPTYNNKSKALTDNICDKVMVKKQSKTYTRKKPPKIKRFNSSSDYSDTDSGKENSQENSYSNVSDIQTHELLIEKEILKSPDESINKIVNNVYFVNKFKHNTSSSTLNIPYEFGRNKMTNNIQSPILPKSPLCSTPFREKYRGASIFKFSPITHEKKSQHKTITAETNDTLFDSVLVPQNNHTKVSKDYQASPITFLPTQSIKNKSNMLVNEEIDISNVNIHENAEQEDINVVKENYNSLSSEGEILQNTEPEPEPFLGFTVSTSEHVINKCQENLKSDISIEKEHVAHEIEIENNKSKLNCSNIILDNSVTKNECSHESQLDSDNESMYNTCSSNQSSEVDYGETNKQLIVAMEKMSDSIFMKFYRKLQTKSEDDISDQTDNDESNSFNNSNEKQLNYSSSKEKDCVDFKSNNILMLNSSTSQDMTSPNGIESINDDMEEIGVSFVTTRRKKEITNDSMFIFENSYGSSSTDCDKTVVSNININLENSNVYKSIGNEYQLDLDIHGEESTNMTDRVSNILSRNSKLFRKSNSMSPRNETCDSNLDTMTPPCFSRSSKQSKHRSPEKYDIDLVGIDNSHSKKECSQIFTRKKSKLLADIDNFKLTDKLSDVNVTRITRNSTNLKKSLIVRPDTSKNYTTIDLNDTVVETSHKEINSNNTTSRDSRSPVFIRSTSVVSKDSSPRRSDANINTKPTIVLQPGKKWERSLSIYRRMTMVENLDQSILEDESLQRKGRKYRQSVISTMEMQEYKDSLHNDSLNSRRSTFVSKPSRHTIRFVKDPNISRISNTSLIFDDLKGFLNEECDDTVIELSKLSIADSEHEVTILDNFHETERVTTARDYVLRRCNQTEPILFDECYPETVLKNCHKIGEGVYGEVFLWRGRDGRARVMKIVPIAGSVKVNGEDQKDFHEIISEIVIAMELSALRAPIAEIERQLDEGNDINALDLHAIENATDIFNEVLAVRCVFGPYPSRLLDLWELYDECKGSENDNPATLPRDQRYIVLELANAGQDLESYQFASAQQAHALFQQIAFGLAVAEEAFQFEHRDLHWGNVLIAPTEQKYATFVLRGRTFRVARGGVAGTVIDYSLSRLSVGLAGAAGALYNDLAADEQLFDAAGDYQFTVYRLMRDKLGNDWKNFEPYTNILWLHYIVDKMITALRYKRTNTKIHKHYIEKLKGIKERILDYGSAVQYVLTDI